MRKTKRLLWLALILVIVSSAVWADYFSIHRLSDWGSGSYLRIHARGKYLYCPGPGGLDIIDVSDHANPVKLSNCHTLKDAREVYVRKNLAFVADGQYGLKIIDVSNPYHPVQLGAWDSDNLCALTIVEKNGYAYVGSYSSFYNDYEFPGNNCGIWVFDVSRPRQPELTHFEPTRPSQSDVWGLHIRGNLLYAAASSELIVMDLTEPAKPTRIFSEENEYRSLYDVYWRGDTLFAQDKKTLRVYDISNRQPPRLKGSFDCRDIGFINYKKIYSKFGHVYLAEQKGLVAIDVSQPHRPVNVWSWDQEGNAMGINGKGNFLHVAVGRSGILSYDISTPNAPLLTGRFSQYNYGAKTIVRGDYAYQVSARRFNIFDISDKQQPIRVNHPEIFDNHYESANCMAIKGKHAFIGTSRNKLLVLDISQKEKPRVVSSTSFFREPRSFQIQGNYLYAADHREGLIIIDISDPAQPVKRSVTYAGNFVLGVLVKGKYAYATTWNEGMKVIDVSDPGAPEIIRVFDQHPECRFCRYMAMDADENYLYVAEHTSDGWYGKLFLRVLDIRDPASPRIIGSSQMEGYPRQVRKDGRFIFIAADRKGIQVVDVKDPRNPIHIKTVDTGGHARGVTVQDNFLYAGNGEGGKLIVYKYGNPRRSPLIEIDRETLELNASTAEPGSPVHTVHVSNEGSGELILYVTKDREWLRFGTDFSRNNNDIMISADARNLSPGKYFGTVTISDPNAVNHFKTVYITLEVLQDISGNGSQGFFELTGGQN